MIKMQYGVGMQIIAPTFFTDRISRWSSSYYLESY